MDKKFTNNLTKEGYFKPNMRTLHDDHYITKQFLISILFSNVSVKKQQKFYKKQKN
jgi:hypothetical protein